MMVLGLNLFCFLMLFDVLSSFFVLSVIIMNMQIRCFTLLTTGRMACVYALIWYQV